MLLRLSTVLLAATHLLPVSALYFYIDGSTPKRLFQELPKHTLVVGTPSPPHCSFLQHQLTSPTGQYKAEQKDIATGRFAENDDLALLITVDETFDSDHRVVNQKGSGKGRFTFTAMDS